MSLRVVNPERWDELRHYMDRHFDALADILDKIQERQFTEEYKRNVGTVQLDGSGQGVIELDAAQGFNRTLERVSIIVTGATAGNVGVFVDSVSPLTLIEFITPGAAGTVTIAPLGAVVAYSDAFNNNLRVPSASKLLVQFSGFAANGMAYCNIQENLSPVAENAVSLHRVQSGLA